MSLRGVVGVGVLSMLPGGGVGVEAASLSADGAL